jgi:hypothetical protein
MQGEMEGDGRRWKAMEWEGSARLDLLADDRVEDAPELVDDPRRVQRKGDADELWVILVGQRRDLAQPADHPQSQLVECYASAVVHDGVAHERARSNAGRIAEIQKVLEGVQVEVPELPRSTRCEP